MLSEEDLRREHYILPMDDEIAIENMRRHIAPAECHDDVFTKDELDYIWKWAFSGNCKPRLNRNGTVLVAGNLHKIYAEFKDKIDPYIGPRGALSPKIGGNYFITPQQYGLHNDSIRPEDWENTLKHVDLKDQRRKWTCWRNVIIPLWIGTHQDEVDGGQIVFFNERHIDWAHVYNGGGKTPNIASVYKISTDYRDLQFHDQNGNVKPKETNADPFDKEMYDKWMNTPYERLNGLSVESVHEWKPGSIMTFDATQLHATNQGTKGTGNHYNSKMGLLLTFLIELDHDLKEDWFLQ